LSSGTDNWDYTLLAHWVAGKHGVRPAGGEASPPGDFRDDGALARWFDDGRKAVAPLTAPLKPPSASTRLKMEGVDVSATPAQDSLRKGSL
jgi:hypothetical protein